MKYQIIVFTNDGTKFDETSTPIPANEAISFINGYEQLARSAKQGAAQDACICLGHDAPTATDGRGNCWVCGKPQKRRNKV